MDSNLENCWVHRNYKNKKKNLRNSLRNVKCQWKYSYEEIRKRVGGYVMNVTVVECAGWGNITMTSDVLHTV